MSAGGRETSEPASPDSHRKLSELLCSRNCLNPKPEGHWVQGLEHRLRAKTGGAGSRMLRAWAMGVTHTSPCPHGHLYPPPQPDRQMKSPPPPSSLLPSPWQPGSRTRTSKSTFRAVGACLIIAENQRKPGQERGETEEDGHTEEGQTEGGREGKRPNRGKGGGDRRLVHQIPTMQPQLPGQQLPSPQMAVTRMQKPHRCTEGQPGSCRHHRGAGPVL